MLKPLLSCNQFILITNGAYQITNLRPSNKSSSKSMGKEINKYMQKN